MNAERSICENVFRSRSSTNFLVCEKVSLFVAKPGAGDTFIYKVMTWGGVLQASVMTWGGGVANSKPPVHVMPRCVEVGPHP